MNLRVFFENIKDKEQYEIVEKLFWISVKVRQILSQRRIEGKTHDKLTHFISFNTFEKIFSIENNEVKSKAEHECNKKEYILRLNNITGCNDPDEGQACFDIFDLKTPSELADSYPLVLSFCRGSPENLPMWHMYADNAKGVALNYGGSICQKINQYGKKNKTKLSMYKVLYVKNLDKSKKFGKSIEDLSDLKDKIDELAKLCPKNSDNSELWEAVSMLFLELAHIIKYDDYEYEKEVRVISFAFRKDIQNNKLRLCPNSHKLYAEMTLNELPDIICGPKMKSQEFEIVRYTMDYYDNKNKTTVKNSRIKYR